MQPSADKQRYIRCLSRLLAIALLCVFGQGCAAVGVALLGTAASTATKTGVSYTLDNRAHKTFTAPMGQVKASLLAALREMAFPIETDESTEEGERIVARVEGREVEAELEPITLKTTKVKVIVREGWFWKDRATAEELIEQTSRDVDATILAARGGGRILPTTFPKPGPARGAEARPVPAALDVWDPQRWREGFQAAPTFAAANAQKAQSPADSQGAGPVGPPVALSMIAVGDGQAPRVDQPRPPAGAPQPVPPPPARTSVQAPGTGDGGEDNRWRVLRDIRLYQCPDAACPPAAPLKKGMTVARLWDKGQWWRVRVTGSDAVGWVLAKDVAPQSWWDPRRPARVSAR